jgi:hypothetical protein
MGLPLIVDRKLKPVMYKGYKIKTSYNVDTYGAFYDWEVFEKFQGRSRVTLTGREQVNAFNPDMTKAKLIKMIKQELDKRDNRPKKLPTVKTGGKIYFVDKRLRQIRNVENYNDFETVSLELINHWEDTGKLKRR